MENLRTFSEYTPHQGQWKYHNSQSKDRIIVSSIRAGKTYGLIYDAIVNAWNIDPDEPYPLPVVLMCAPTFSQVKDLLFNPMKALTLKLGLYKRSSSMLSAMAVELKNGREIVFRTLGADASQTIRGITAKCAYIDECALVKEEAVNICRGRLLTTNGRLTLATTPRGKGNWFYQQHFSSTAIESDDIEIFRYHIRDNPTITDEAVDHLRNTYSPLLYEQEVEGKFVSLNTSRIYYEFDFDRNVTHEATLPPRTQGHKIFIGLDYNIDKNPLIFAYKDHLGRIIVFEEKYGLKTAKDVGNFLQAKYGQTSLRDLFIVDDAKSGTARSQPDGTTNREVLNQLGIHNIYSSRKNPPRTERYANVNAHLCNAKGTARLIIHPSCKHLIKDLQELEYKPSSDRPETVSEKLGHASDALGYLLNYLSPYAGREGTLARTQKIRFEG